jgi:anti-sigma regulatory factor (Ser/Thr protein kinase)
VSGLRHEALLYEGDGQFGAGVARFVRDGLGRGEPVLLAVPAERHPVVRRALGKAHRHVRLRDMSELGRNPGRILSAIGDWVGEHGARRTRFVGEPIWPGRTGDEILEATQHEALINLALADAPITVLCPYDACGLAPGVLVDAERTHPTVVRDGTHRISAAYDAAAALAATGQPLSVPATARASESLAYGFGDLHSVRMLVQAHGEREGLAPHRVEDLVLAASEAAANSVRHGGGRGTVSIWRDDGRVVCEFADDGRMDDPMTGRRRPPREHDHGRGVWLIHQLCDLVQVRSGPQGTSVRVHMRIG